MNTIIDQQLPLKSAGERADQEGRNLILVLGMHRSGTSALAGTLHHLGVEVGSGLVEPTKDNPRGYFEDLATVVAQEALLEALGYRWHDPRPLPKDWLASDEASSARVSLLSVVDELFGSGRLAAVKDPRSCRLVALWREVAQEADVKLTSVLMLRHPSEVAASLHRRDKISRTRAFLVWSRYFLDAERETRGMPRAFVVYDALLENWRRETDRIGNTLGVEMPEVTDAIVAEVDEFLDVSLRNHAGASQGASSDPFEVLAMALYQLALDCIEGSATDTDSQFDQFAAQLDVLAQPYLEAVQDSVALEVQSQMEKELQAQGLNKARVDMALQLSTLSALWQPAAFSRRQGACKLYYRDGSTSFIEGRSVSVHPVVKLGTQTVVFELPPGVTVTHLRIDPNDAPGIFAVQSIRIRGNILADVQERVTGISEIKLPGSFMAPIRFAALGDDPHIELGVHDLGPLADPDGVIRIELKFRVETVASQISDQMQDVIFETQKEIGLAFDGVHTRQDGLDSDIVATREEIVGTREEISRLRDEIAVVRNGQNNMLAWAQRRSPRYWWNRILGRDDNNKKTSG